MGDESADRQMSMRAILLLFALALVAGAVISAVKAQDCEEGAYGCGHQENHDKYKGWKSNSGGSCCDGKDCRPVHARQDEDGRWEVYIPEFKGMTHGDYLVKGWLKIPPSQVQAADRWKDGRSHICTSPIYAPDSPVARGFQYPVLPNTYCFSPAQPKS